MVEACLLSYPTNPKVIIISKQIISREKSFDKTPNYATSTLGQQKWWRKSWLPSSNPISSCQKHWKKNKHPTCAGSKKTPAFHQFHNHGLQTPPYNNIRVWMQEKHAVAPPDVLAFKFHQLLNWNWKYPTFRSLSMLLYLHFQPHLRDLKTALFTAYPQLYLCRTKHPRCSVNVNITVYLDYCKFFPHSNLLGKAKNKRYYCYSYTAGGSSSHKQYFLSSDFCGFALLSLHYHWSPPPYRNDSNLHYQSFSFSSKGFPQCLYYTQNCFHDKRPLHDIPLKPTFIQCPYLRQQPRRWCMLQQLSIKLI